MLRNSYRGNKDEVRALNAYIKLMRASESVSARTHRHLSDARLTASQFGALEALYHLGPLSQADLGQKILRTSGNITMVVDNLEKRRLVKRERRQEDRRYYTVRLTTGGEKLIAEVFPRHVGKIVEAMNALTKTEQETLGRLCRKLGLQNKG